MLGRTRGVLLHATQFGIAVNDDRRQPDAKDKLKATFAAANVPAEIEATHLQGWRPHRRCEGEWLCAWCDPDAPASIVPEESCCVLRLDLAGQLSASAAEGSKVPAQWFRRALGPYRVNHCYRIPS